MSCDLYECDTFAVHNAESEEQQLGEQLQQDDANIKKEDSMLKPESGEKLQPPAVATMELDHMTNFGGISALTISPVLPQYSPRLIGVEHAVDMGAAVGESTTCHAEMGMTMKLQEQISMCSNTSVAKGEALEPIDEDDEDQADNAFLRLSSPEKDGNKADKAVSSHNSTSEEQIVFENKPVEQSEQSKLYEGNQEAEDVHHPAAASRDADPDRKSRREVKRFVKHTLPNHVKRSSTSFAPTAVVNSVIDISTSSSDSSSIGCFTPERDLNLIRTGEADHVFDNQNRNNVSGLDQENHIMNTSSVSSSATSTGSSVSQFFSDVVQKVNQKLNSAIGVFPGNSQQNPLTSCLTPTSTRYNPFQLRGETVYVKHTARVHKCENRNCGKFYQFYVGRESEAKCPKCGKKMVGNNAGGSDAGTNGSSSSAHGAAGGANGNLKFTSLSFADLLPKQCD